MTMRLDARASDFETSFRALLAMKREVSEDVDRAAKEIIDAVIARGDEAVIAFTEKFDGLALTPATLRITNAEIDAAMAQCALEQSDALKLARDRIEAYHLQQK
ncbi:MAG: histidinol dehydrogenase, partial [Beijerinckiaceae bacterium]|nr:histidinol dehydrogenase [Beijerinckiaceae bacterium]